MRRNSDPRRGLLRLGVLGTSALVLMGCVGCCSGAIEGLIAKIQTQMETLGTEIVVPRDEVDGSNAETEAQPEAAASESTEQGGKDTGKAAGDEDGGEEDGEGKDTGKSDDEAEEPEPEPEPAPAPQATRSSQPAPPPPPEPAADDNNLDDLDAMLNELDDSTGSDASMESLTEDLDAPADDGKKKKKKKRRRK